MRIGNNNSVLSWSLLSWSLTKLHEKSPGITSCGWRLPIYEPTTRWHSEPAIIIKSNNNVEFIMIELALNFLDLKLDVWISPGMLSGMLIGMLFEMLVWNALPNVCLSSDRQELDCQYKEQSFIATRRSTWFKQIELDEYFLERLLPRTVLTENGCYQERSLLQNLEENRWSNPSVRSKHQTQASLWRDRGE